jgi:putative oxidoreductase
MKKYIYLSLLATMLLAISCVQKSADKTVVYFLRVNGAKNIQSVGIRGEGKPYSWNNDLPLTPVVKDSLYTATITARTGYKFVPVKFTINGEFELADKDNRKVLFSAKDTTIYTATFNVVEQ